jgi:hypothetical protein
MEKLSPYFVHPLNTKALSEPDVIQTGRYSAIMIAVVLFGQLSKF